MHHHLGSPGVIGSPSVCVSESIKYGVPNGTFGQVPRSWPFAHDVLFTLCQPQSKGRVHEYPTNTAYTTEYPVW